MKKLFSMLVVALLALNMTFVFADDDDRSYYISNFETDLYVQSNGDVLENDKITYEMDGKYNGIYRDVYFSKNLKNKGVYPDSNLYNAEGVEDIKIDVVSASDFIQNVIPSSSENENTYIETYKEKEVRYKIFKKIEDTSKTFMLSYNLKNACVTHNDCSELYIGLLGDDSRIRDGEVRIHFPDADQNIEDIIAGIYPHTTGDNVSVKYEGKECIINVRNVGSGNLFDIRLVVNPGYIKSEKLSNIDALPEIDKVENKLKDEQKYLKDKANVQWIFVAVAGAYFIFAIKKYIELFKKYEKEKEANFKDKYSMDIPNEDRDPIMVSLIETLGSKAMDYDVILDCLFYLVQKKVIKMDSNKVMDKKGKVSYEYKLTLVKDYKNEKQYIKDVVKLIFKDKKEVELKERLKKMEKSTSDYEKLGEIWKSAKDVYQEECEYTLTPLKEEKGVNVTKLAILLMLASAIVTIISPDNTLLLLSFNPLKLIGASIGALITGLIASLASMGFSYLISKSAGKKDSAIASVIFNILLNLVVMCASSFLVNEIQNEVAGIGTMVFMLVFAGIGTLLSVAHTTRQNDDIVEEKAKWKALKNYITNYSKLKDKEAAHIINWEQYMVYAIAFGVAAKVKKELEMVFPNQEENTAFMYYNCHTMMHSSCSSCASNYASSQSSSSGGFSGGGGGGIGSGGGAF